MNLLYLAAGAIGVTPIGFVVRRTGSHVLWLGIPQHFCSLPNHRVQRTLHKITAAFSYFLAVPLPAGSQGAPLQKQTGDSTGALLYVPLHFHRSKISSRT